MAAACTLGKVSVSSVEVSRMETGFLKTPKLFSVTDFPQLGQPYLERIKLEPFETICSPCTGQIMVIGRSTPSNDITLKCLNGNVLSVSSWKVLSEYLMVAPVKCNHFR